MSDKLSPESYSDRVARELEKLVKSASGPVVAGSSVKAQIMSAYRNLGRPAYWRVRDAWYGAAGNWTAAAVEEFRDRYRMHCARRLREQEARERAGRTAAVDALSQLQSTVEALRALDEDFYCDTIAEMERAIDAARHLDRPMAQAGE